MALCEKSVLQSPFITCDSFQGKYSRVNKCSTYLKRINLKILF
jgi:hypothetical protein